MLLKKRLNKVLVFTHSDVLALLEESDYSGMPPCLFFPSLKCPGRKVDMYSPKLYKLLLFHEHICSSTFVECLFVVFIRNNAHNSLVNKRKYLLTLFTGKILEVQGD